MTDNNGEYWAGEFNNVYKAQKVGNIIPSSIYTRPSKDYPFFPAWVPSGKVEKAYNISRPPLFWLAFTC